MYIYWVFIKYCVFYEDFKIYSGLWTLSVSLRCQCVFTMIGQTPALQQNLQSSEKSQHIKEKDNTYVRKYLDWFQIYVYL